MTWVIASGCSNCDVPDYYTPSYGASSAVNSFSYANSSLSTAPVAPHMTPEKRLISPIRMDRDQLGSTTLMLLGSVRSLFQASSLALHLILLSEYTHRLLIVNSLADSLYCMIRNQTTLYLKDGLMGLKLPSSGRSDLPLPWALKAKGVTQSSLFAFYFTPSGGEISIGAVNSARYKNSIAWTPVVDTSVSPVGRNTLIPSYPLMFFSSHLSQSGTSTAL